MIALYFRALSTCFISLSLTCHAVDLEKFSQTFVLETKKIEIDEHPYAFNPSLVVWRGAFLLSFRELPSLPEHSECSINSSGLSQIGLQFLSDDFNPEGKAYILELPSPHAEDARLIIVDGRLYIVFSDNTDELITHGGFRMYVGELDFDGSEFFLKSLEGLKHFPGVSPSRREKNWVPFNYCDMLLLAYSIQPHRIFIPYLDGSEECMEWTETTSHLNWRWGELRGGTPALRCGNEYLAFFHSSIDLATVHSGGEKMPHYFMGAYTFQAYPPFALTRISPFPIIGTNFYHGQDYPYYWKPVRVVFPGGYFFEGDSIYLTYGRQDHEIWIAKIDKEGLFNSLVQTRD